MNYVVILLMVLFLGAGVALVWYGFKQWGVRRASASRLLHLEGVVLTVTRKESVQPIDRKKNRYKKKTWMFFPVIRFTLPNGEQITFQSETGDSGRKSSFSAGQRLPVLYDPEKELPPMIDTWWGVWGMVFALLMGGGFLIGGSLLILFTFVSRMEG